MILPEGIDASRIDASTDDELLALLAEHYPPSAAGWVLLVLRGEVAEEHDPGLEAWLDGLDAADPGDDR